MKDSIEAVVLYALQKQGNYVMEEDFNKIEGISPKEFYLGLKDAEQIRYFIVAAGMGSDPKWYLTPDGKLFGRTLNKDN